MEEMKKKEVKKLRQIAARHTRDIWAGMISQVYKLSFWDRLVFCLKILRKKL